MRVNIDISEKHFTKDFSVGNSESMEIPHAPIQILIMTLFPKILYMAREHVVVEVCSIL